MIGSKLKSFELASRLLSTTTTILVSQHLLIPVGTTCFRFWLPTPLDVSSPRIEMAPQPAQPPRDPREASDMHYRNRIQKLRDRQEVEVIKIDKTYNEIVAEAKGRTRLTRDETDADGSRVTRTFGRRDTVIESRDGVELLYLMKHVVREQEPGTKATKVKRAKRKRDEVESGGTRRDDDGGEEVVQLSSSVRVSHVRSSSPSFVLTFEANRPFTHRLLGIVVSSNNSGTISPNSLLLVNFQRTLDTREIRLSTQILILINLYVTTAYGNHKLDKEKGNKHSSLRIRSAATNEGPACQLS